MLEARKRVSFPQHNFTITPSQLFNGPGRDPSTPVGQNPDRGPFLTSPSPPVKHQVGPSSKPQDGAHTLPNPLPPSHAIVPGPEHNYRRPLPHLHVTSPTRPGGLRIRPAARTILRPLKPVFKQRVLHHTLLSTIRLFFHFLQPYG
jgi:hypothetical protein